MKKCFLLVAFVFIFVLVDNLYFHVIGKKEMTAVEKPKVPTPVSSASLDDASYIIDGDDFFSTFFPRDKERAEAMARDNGATVRPYGVSISNLIPGQKIVTGWEKVPGWSVWRARDHVTTSTQIEVQLTDGGTITELGWLPVAGKMIMPKGTDQLVLPFCPNPTLRESGRPWVKKWAILTPIATLRMNDLKTTGELFSGEGKLEVMVQRWNSEGQIGFLVKDVRRVRN